jgi:hypothetical protein
MKLFLKKISVKVYLLIIAFKKLLMKGTKNQKFVTLSVLKLKYAKKKRIVVLASGPSANKVPLDSTTLYLVTNSGYKLIKGFDFLYFVNDGFYIKKLLAFGNFYLKENQELVFFYQDSDLHKKGLNFLEKYIGLLKNKRIYLISEIALQSNAKANWKQFSDFYIEKKLPIKIQNSGVFLLLMGYFLAKEMNLPIEIYGLDLGVGGAKHFDNKGVTGKSVTNDRVKKNVKMYLDFMNKDCTVFINNSNFKN